MRGAWIKLSTPPPPPPPPPPYCTLKLVICYLCLLCIADERSNMMTSSILGTSIPRMQYQYMNQTYANELGLLVNTTVLEQNAVRVRVQTSTFWYVRQ